jgi:hypothetical protein
MYNEYSQVQRLPISFRTAKQLRGRVEMLPRGPQWKCKLWPTSHPTKRPVNLYFRDAIECLNSLFGSPLFADHMQYSPFRVFKTAEKLVRVYEEWMSGDAAWDMQVCSRYPSAQPTMLTVSKDPVTGRCNSPRHYTVIR